MDGGIGTPRGCLGLCRVMVFSVAEDWEAVDA